MAGALRPLMILGCAVLFACFLPTASADDEMASASLLTSGSTVNEYVCYTDGCNPNDERDWWTIYAYTGDVIDVAASGSGNNMNIWCFASDGWEAKVKITNSNGDTKAGDNTFSNDGASTTLSYSVDFEGWFYIRVKGIDTWCNDGVDYSLTATLDSLNRDTDNDGVLDTDDGCDNSPGTSTEDVLGCPDSDGDGWSNEGDAFPDEASQWSDSDGDGYGDNQNGVLPDDCPNEEDDRLSPSTQDRLGCPDRDNDGWSDPDPWGESGPVWTIMDGADAYWEEPTQWRDTDGDGYGDNWDDKRWNQTHEFTGLGIWIEGAYMQDACPAREGYSTGDRPGCIDSDGDTWSDPDGNWTITHGADAFPSDPSQWRDSDGDGFGDNYTWTLDEDGFRIENGDAFPLNPTQWSDSDGDSWGDNQDSSASRVDAFPLEPSQWSDIDDDGFGDNQSGFQADACPVDWGLSIYDRFGCLDSDEDGYSDPEPLGGWAAHPIGFADAFPYEETQWFDTDGDGYGDNQTENAWQPDSCMLTSGESSRDRWGCPDSDRDGASDPDISWIAHPIGMGDAFPDDITQWEDTDGDGYGDNPVGTTPDSCKDIPGTSTQDRFGCTDTDGDKWSDQGDAFPHEPTQRLDTDGDGWGDNQNGHEPDACPFTKGDSLLDRLGCPDTDSDGFSDPDENWLAHPEGNADAFEGNRLQWLDTDGDGYGDNPIGNWRDDCPFDAGKSNIDFQGCPDSNNDGYSNNYGEINAAITIMGDNPLSSWITYLSAFILLLIAVGITRTKKGEVFNE